MVSTVDPQDCPTFLEHLLDKRQERKRTARASSTEATQEQGCTSGNWQFTRLSDDQRINACATPHVRQLATDRRYLIDSCHRNETSLWIQPEPVRAASIATLALTGLVILPITLHPQPVRPEQLALQPVERI
ncbi:hypothetical protein [Ralstonia sp. ASV6]|uniref:hypothetical protein n=1 Tax=Ralstonia sp. ASV6 TaxID=2795124 RepID=UPI0018EAA9B3|nr:hypothetical protein [Ralstonia sp. ASV6]